MAPSFRLTLAVASLAVASLAVLAGCTSAADIGEACTDSADCLAGLSCFVHEGATPSPVCMADCTLSTTRICEGGAVCSLAMRTPPMPDRGVCYLGGTTAVGAACTGNLECVRGAICVDTGGTQACHRACSTSDAAGCAAGETCAALTGMGTSGFCQATAP